MHITIFVISTLDPCLTFDSVSVFRNIHIPSHIVPMTQYICFAVFDKCFILYFANDIAESKVSLSCGADLARILLYLED